MLSQMAQKLKPLAPSIRADWAKLRKMHVQLVAQSSRAENAFAFAFVEGVLVNAIQQGHWILLDEINLATNETLECLNGILEGANGSIVIAERGDMAPIVRHPDFRLFACMNPATDVGKRDLPAGVRNRFTEFYVGEPRNDEDLLLIVREYIKRVGSTPAHVPQRIVELFQAAKSKAASHELRDGNGQSPHYSLRTLCRALLYAQVTSPHMGYMRALYEGVCMSFLTQLDMPSNAIVTALCKERLLNGRDLVVKKIAEVPPGHISIYDFLISCGDRDPVDPGTYIMTPSVKENLTKVARAVSSKLFPVLLQGPTSCGKTSMIEHLAMRTGHRFVRINNHEHTDIQEYLGSYVSDNDGRLVFREGALVEAVRNGYWIVLDELNLAPTDVLEALNRLLDDNRELFIHETQTTVKPHPEFMLFATQNPPGSYGGRKPLSRAFRNRFIELHFDDLPAAELKTILEERCKLPKKFCTALVAVLKELQKLRQGTRLFAGKHGFITLRDLFRWAQRYQFSQHDEYVDHWQILTDDGYMLLAERVRDPKEKAVVQRVLELHLKRKVDIAKLYSCESIPLFQQFQEAIGQATLDPTHALHEFRNVVWTKDLKRMFSLVHRSLETKEPILLVGETGCGKTTVVQVLAVLMARYLHIINCHQHTETADFIGGLRPVRHRYASKSCVLVCTTIQKPPERCAFFRPWDSTAGGVGLLHSPRAPLCRRELCAVMRHLVAVLSQFDSWYNDY